MNKNCDMCFSTIVNLGEMIGVFSSHRAFLVNAFNYTKVQMK